MTNPAVWYLMRASGVVALLLLTLACALGAGEAGRLHPARLPRFALVALHRNVSLLAVAFLALHVATSLADPDASVGLLATVVPLPSDRYGIWLAVGAVSLDLLAAVGVTSALRHRLSLGSWRAVHLSAYAAWPIALAHGVGMGSDARSAWLIAVDVVCVACVAAAAAVRLPRLRALGEPLQ
jgi:sulfoxide reductase heme-binding subunit YedZ